MRQGHVTRQRAGIVLVALGTILASFVLIAPGAGAQNPALAGRVQRHMEISIPLDTIARGFEGTTKVLATEAVPPDLIGVTCETSWVSNNNTSVHPNNDLIVESATTAIVPDVEREAGAITIGGGTLTLGPLVTVSVRFGPDQVFSAGGVLNIDCPDEILPVSVAVTPGVCVWDGVTSSTEVTVTIDPDSGATVTLAGQQFTGTGGTITLGPGQYDWTAVASQGFELQGPSSGSITVVSCEPGEEDVSVVVAAGPCTWDGQESFTEVTIVIEPAGGATVEINGQTITSAGGTVVLTPGSYEWTATPWTGFVLVGPASGTIVAESCEPAPVSVDVVAGTCVWDGEESTTEVTITIDPADGATVTIDGQTISGNGGTVVLTPGTYDWTAEPADGLVIDGPTSGTITAIDCSDQPQTATVSVVAGTCVYDGVNALTEVTIAVDPAGAAQVTVIGDVGVIVADQDMSVKVEPGDYTWEAAPIGDVVLEGPTAGAFTAVDCTPPGTLIVDKVTTETSDEVFQFTLGDTTFELSDGESASFELPAGEYTVSEDVAVLDGWELVDLTCSGDSSADVTTGSATLIVPPGETVGCTFVNGQDEAVLGAIGDLVWNDVDADGVQESGEPGIGGATVELLTPAGSTVETTTTNDAGIYVFANVPEGDYRVRFTVPDTFLFTDANVGSDDAVDSDVTQVSGQVGTTDTFSLAAGASDTTIDAGVFEIEVETETPEPPANPNNPQPPPGDSSTNVPDTPEPDTQVLGIQELPDTGLSSASMATLAVALLMIGVGLLMAVAKEQDGPETATT